MLPNLSLLRLGPARRPMPRGRPLGMTAEHPELIRKLESLKRQLYDNGHPSDDNADDAERALRAIMYGFFVAEGQTYESEDRYFDDMDAFTTAYHEAPEIWQILLKEMLRAVVSLKGGARGRFASAVRAADELFPQEPPVLPEIYPPPPPPPPPAPVGLYAEDDYEEEVEPDEETLALIAKIRKSLHTTTSKSTESVGNSS